MYPRGKTRLLAGGGDPAGLALTARSAARRGFARTAKPQSGNLAAKLNAYPGFDMTGARNEK
jgi:hypothetical protein